MSQTPSPHKEDPLEAHLQALHYARDFNLLYAQSKEQHRRLELLNHQLVRYATDLNTTVTTLKRKNDELQDAYRDTIYRLVAASEYRDQDTGAHITRISRYSALLAEKLGLASIDVQNILNASPMHDVGKIGIPDIILHKPGKLTDAEFELIKTHTTIGAGILADSTAPVLVLAQAIAISHHEKWDGSGYPHGLAGEEIPLAGRIVALVDAFDALTSKRPYKDPYPVDVACSIIRKNSTAFDPALVDLLDRHIDDVLLIRQECTALEYSIPAEFKFSERDRGLPEA